MHKVLRIILLIVLVGANVSGFAYAESKILPKQARNMSPAKVRQIYSDHTWHWETGGAYFAKDGSFYAATGSGATLSTAAGRWLVTPGGRLCFIADWSMKSGLFRNVKSCFNHAEYNGQYFQAKGLSGNWYVIKSAKHKSDDMLNKIKTGDQVACQFLASEKKLKGKLANKLVAKSAKREICSKTLAAKTKRAIL